MRLLVDTQVLLWWLNDDSRLADDIKTLIELTADTSISAVTIWEISVKMSLGKLTAPADLLQTIHHQGFQELPIRHAHAAEVGALPLHHRDPFDRMLVAQARIEGLTIVTHDPAIQRYDVPVLAA